MNTRLLAPLLLVACAHAQPSPAPTGFAQFADAYFASVFARSPSRATRTGFHEGNDARLEDLSRAAIDAQVAELHAQEAQLAAIRKGELSFDDSIDAQLIDNQIHSALLDLETLRTWEVNPMGYVRLPGGSIDGLMKRDFAPAQERLRSVIARLRLVPRIYLAGKENLKNPPKEFTELAIRLARGSVGFFGKSVAAWAKGAAGSDAALLAEFEQANAAAAAAASDFSEWLQKDLLPRSQGQYAIGAESFLRKLKYDDMVELPLPELLAKGEAQLAKDHAAFVETAKQIDAAKTPHEVMAALSDIHPAEGDLIASVARSVEDARRFVVEKDLVTVPSEVRVKVEPTPPYARAATFASMDTPGPFETRAAEAFYYVTPVEPDWDAKHKEEHLRLYNPWVVGMINVHEAYPGHYLEFLYAKRFPTKTRKLVHSSSNSEGWAHYAEQMAVEQGFGGGDPRMQLAQLSEALVRDCRYVVGVQLHTGGWTVEAGAKLFREQCFMEPANALEEAKRGTYNPTYLYYTLGKLEIQELARDYLAQKHATLKQFHDAFVAQGALPVPLVRKILLGGAAGGASAAPASGSYAELVALFGEWRAAQRPRLAGGVPDYTPAAIEAQRQALAALRQRLLALEIRAWPVPQQVDWHIVRAEMNGLDFDHRVLRPWAENPAFYATVFDEKSDQPAREGPFALGAVEAWKLRFPLDAAAARVLEEGLSTIPTLLAQARGNLTGDKRDLWVYGAKTMRQQEQILAKLLGELSAQPAAAAAAQRARDATGTFAAWVEEQAKGKTAPSGIGVENFDWYAANVQLVPWNHREQTVLMERELARARATLLLEEQKNRALPPLLPVASAEEHARRFPPAVKAYVEFLRAHEVMTVRDYFEPALLAEIGRYTPKRPLEFFLESDYREPMAMRTHGYHWMDLAMMEREPNPDPIRRGALLYNIFDTRTEGNATAMEELMMHLGLFEQSPRARELIYVLIAQRAARALGELQMASNKLSLEEAARFAAKNTPRGWLRLEGGTVWFEQHLYLQQPGYGTSYLTGKLLLDQLLAAQGEQQGAAFSVRRHFDALNAAGLIPASLLLWEQGSIAPEFARR